MIFFKTAPEIKTKYVLQVTWTSHSRKSPRNRGKSKI